MSMFTDGPRLLLNAATIAKNVNVKEVAENISQTLNNTAQAGRQDKLIDAVVPPQSISGSQPQRNQTNAAGLTGNNTAAGVNTNMGAELMRNVVDAAIQVYNMFKEILDGVVGINLPDLPQGFAALAQPTVSQTTSATE